MPYLFTPDQYEASLEVVDAAAQQQDRDPSSIERGPFVFVSVHEDRAIARQRAVDRLSWQYGQDFTGLVDRFVAIGTPEDVIDRIRCFTEAGASTVFLGCACEDQDMEANERLLASEVLPALR
jgi:alkanesulfonate monooxygenase SsuD/methylene tetrahydromethanopterin reductase-like flavin-dependent oxidoreductase (luciferase family)